MVCVCGGVTFSHCLTYIYTHARTHTYPHSLILSLSHTHTYSFSRLHVHTRIPTHSEKRRIAKELGKARPDSDTSDDDGGFDEDDEDGEGGFNGQHGVGKKKKKKTDDPFDDPFFNVWVFCFFVHADACCCVEMCVAVMHMGVLRSMLSQYSCQRVLAR